MASSVLVRNSKSYFLVAPIDAQYILVIVFKICFGLLHAKNSKNHFLKFDLDIMTDFKDFKK